MQLIQKFALGTSRDWLDFDASNDGAEQTLVSGSTNGVPDFVMMDDTHFFLAYSAEGSNILKGAYCTINSDKTITVNDTVTLDATGKGDSVCAVKVDTNKVLVTYTKATGTNKGYAVAATISGLTINSVGAVKQLNDEQNVLSCSSLGSGNAVVQWGGKNLGSSLTGSFVMALTVSGVTVNLNTESRFSTDLYHPSSGVGGENSIVAVDTGVYLASMGKSASGFYTLVFTISGTTITGVGSPQIATDSNTGIASMNLKATGTAGQAAAAYSKDNVARVSYFTVSGLTATQGTAVNAGVGSVASVSFAVPASGRYVVSYYWFNASPTNNTPYLCIIPDSGSGPVTNPAQVEVDNDTSTPQVFIRKISSGASSGQILMIARTSGGEIHAFVLEK